MSAGTTLRIAWRNLGRNRRRTGLGVAAIALSQTLVLFYGGILTGYETWMVRTITGPLLGHVQAHAPGWRKDRAMDRVLDGVDGALAALRRDPGVASASARIYAPALAARGLDGNAVVAIGVMPALESGPSGLLAGAPAAIGGSRVLVGDALARRIGAATGDTLALVGQGADGSLANDLVVVAGVVSTPVDMVNREGVLMDLGTAQELFSMPGAAHEIVVHARDPKRVTALAMRIAAMPAFRGADVLEWTRLAPQLVAYVELMRAAWIFILLFVLLAAAAGVANTMLMATFERTREIGMLLALGAAPRRIVAMVVAESVALGVAGALLGTALGGALIAVTHQTGVDLSKLASGAPSELSFAGLRVSMRLFPAFDAGQALQGIAAVIATALLASAWPATRAARLQPSRAMRV